jgi:hypothetical protein
MATKNRGFSKEDELISFSPVRENSYTYKKASLDDTPVGGTTKTFEQLVQEQLSSPNYTVDSSYSEGNKQGFLKKKHNSLANANTSFTPRIKPVYKEKSAKDISSLSEPKTQPKKKQKFLKRGQGTLCVKTNLNKSEKSCDYKETPDTSRPLDSLPTPVSLEESSIKQRQNVTITKPKHKSEPPKAQKKPEVDEDAIEFDPDAFEEIPNMSDEFEEKLREMNEQVFRLREQRQAVKMQTKTYEAKTQELQEALEKFRSEKEDIIKNVENWKNEEIRKMKKERLNQEKNAKFVNIGSKKELEEIEEIRNIIEKLKEDSAAMDTRQILTMDKLKKQLDEFSTQNVLLEQELRYLEKRRIQSMNEPKSSKKKAPAQASGSSQQVLYKNGAKKEVFPDGRVLITYPNGDSKETFPDGKQIYNFSEAGTIQTSMSDGLQIIEFQNGQVEKHFPDGSKEIRFGDGSVKHIYSDGSEEIEYPDGTVQKTDCKKVKYIEFPNGHKDIINPNSSRIRN